MEWSSLNRTAPFEHRATSCVIQHLQASCLEMSNYVVIFEKSDTGYGAYAPDLPGCIATGSTLEQTKRRIQTAIHAHVELLRELGYSVPEPQTVVMALSA